MNCDSRRKVLVTAGSKGLSSAIAKRLAQDGAHVVICGRDQSARSVIPPPKHHPFTAAMMGAGD
ncbi:SDR family NAD(P)-dependent oxidoreductase [Bradyrhizobium sp. 160]|uniref:SDR family NAD(P)-dependent oxidoreductase n=1 Tax=Bradyrhizobium sp. 160 TaxID=2782634 RepID=UPI002112DBFB|nr:SDR family NAD(P)-dependent oxidoreductase [Bradyrhizobium sp. 160]MCK1624104.1 SDR family NAD(P)-dependent oxidoreductase [Bradyrhizobium sp. 160]